MAEHLIDNRGLACPQPVINTKKALDSLRAGTIVSLVDNVTARENVSRLATSLGCTHDIEEKDGLFYVRITKSDISQVDISAPIAEIAAPAIASNRLLLISSKEFGNGERELGEILMKSFLYAVSQATDLLPKYIVLLNGGVWLSLPETPAFAHLKHLDELGVEIICCGTCLDYYGLKERSGVGRVTNMYEIYELMCRNSTIEI